MSYDPGLFAEKYQLAWQSAIASKPQGGLCGFEYEWNLLDSEFKPLLTVGSGPRRQSFVDYLRAGCLTPRAREYSQLEVFNWMIEWATRPYYHPRGAVYEGRLLEAVLCNALHKAGRQFNDRLYAWYGNLLFQTSVGPQSIPGAWNLAKRRYLERCVDLYGQALATAGTHTNLSLPEPLLAWDFMHLSPSERGDTHLDDYKSEFYITSTRLLRAFGSLFIATSASTPMRAETRDGKPVVVLTEDDSVRNLTFPNPPTLDLPDLYRSYKDYLHISYDLVRRGVRFGNNNWTPVRARSFAEPVERLILVTSDQLQDLYGRGLYAAGEAGRVEEMAHQIEIQNLMARINLPMSRVEVRTDDGGHPLEVDVANLTLKHLLLLRSYADPDFGRQFRYDREDIARARRNEELASRQGLRAEIENPLTAKPVQMREFLSWTLGELDSLAHALGNWDDLLPLREMAGGGPNTAQRMRARLRAELGHQDEVPVNLLKRLAEEREVQVLHDVEMIAETCCFMTGEESKLGDFLQRARDEVRLDPQVPVRFRPRPEAMLEITYPDKTSEILALAQQLVRIPSVTACPEERVEEVHRAATFIFDYVRNHGLQVRYYNQSKYPAVLAGLPGQMNAPVMFSGHFDVVAPDPDDSQFEPRIEGDYLWGRGAADMKTVVATYLVWLKDTLRQGPPYPPVNLLLVGNEENGESEPMGTPYALRLVAEEERTPDGEPYAPRILIAGERTGERGNELWGQVCIQNRGVFRLEVVVRGERGHTATSAQSELSERLVQARSSIAELFNRALTLKSVEGWQSQVRFPFIQVGTPGVFNISADLGVLGIEVRPIPEDDMDRVLGEVKAYCTAQGLELRVLVKENGIACSPDNPYLKALIRAVEGCSGAPAIVGKKLPGTSARFAPGGQGVVWGQSGLGPHARGERHYVPSILPYYQAMQEYGKVLLAQGA
jgi:succinyl-diaminopimelate desuccinylase